MFWLASSSQDDDDYRYVPHRRQRERVTECTASSIPGKSRLRGSCGYFRNALGRRPPSRPGRIDREEEEEILRLYEILIFTVLSPLLSAPYPRDWPYYWIKLSGCISIEHSTFPPAHPAFRRRRSQNAEQNSAWCWWCWQDHMACGIFTH